MVDNSAKIEAIKKHVACIPDFPKPGIIFRDIFSVLRDPVVFKDLRDVLVSTARSIHPPVECVTALDARGFLFGPLVALELQVPFVPIRKKGKLPGRVQAITYALEYGEDTLEIQEDSIKKHQNVLIIDDLLATGGTLRAACDLIAKLEGNVIACLVIMELVSLNGRKNIPATIYSLINF